MVGGALLLVIVRMGFVNVELDSSVREMNIIRRNDFEHY
jgi:hypothetical protein